MSVGYRVIAASELDDALAARWRALVEARPDYSSPYFSPEFTRLVAQVRDGVRIAIVERDRQPVGFLPFEKGSWGIGRPVGGPLSDYHGLVVAADCEWQPELLLRAAGLSSWTFNHLAGDTRAFEAYAWERAGSPRIDLSGGYAEYVKGRRQAGSEYIPKTEGLARKLGREVGELRFTMHEPAPEVLAQLFQWKSAQYREASIPDVFSASWTRQLLALVAEADSADFAGVCSVLRAGERVVAIHLGMRSRHELHYWFPAYDPSLARYSTGIILLLRSMEALAGQGVTVVDLGKGDAQYKQRLMTDSRELLIGAIEAPSLARLLRQAYRYVEAREAKLPAVLRLPLRAMRRLERQRRFR